MRRLVQFVVSIFILTVLSLWVVKRYQGFWEPHLRARIEDEGKKLLGAPLHIDRIEYVFPHRVRLLHVVAEPVFEARNITLTVDIFDIVPAFLRRKPVQSFGIIHLQDPHVHLSLQDIQTWKNRPHAVRTKKKSFPLFFAVTWENGTFEYGDLQIEDLTGAYRIRGPQQSFALRGESTLARAMRIQFSSLGDRWNAQAYAKEGDLARGLQLIQQMTAWKMPPRWSASGPVDIEIQAEGREKPVAAHWPRYLKRADVALRSGTLTVGENAFPVTLTATLDGGGDAWEIKNARVDFADNTWQASSRISGWTSGVTATLDASLPTGTVAKRTITQTEIHLRYEKRLWTLTDGHATWGPGRIQASGVFRPQDMDVRVTGTDLPVSELLSAESKTPVHGRLNLSTVLDGTYKEWQLRGSWWIDDLLWNKKRLASRWRGNLESQPSGAFSVRGDSPDSSAHLIAQGSYRSPLFDIQNLQLNLGNGETLLGEASGSFRTQMGTYTLRTDRWTWAHQAVEKVNIHAQWAPDFMAVSIEGQHQRAPEADWAPFDSRWTWTPKAIDIQSLHYRLLPALLTAQGRVQLGRPTALPIQLTGIVNGSKSDFPWSIPFQANGVLRPEEEWAGQATLQTSSITIRGDHYAPINTLVDWTLEGLKWRDMTYARAWTSNGQWRWDPAAPICQADVALTQVSLQQWIPSSATLSGAVHLTNNCRDLATQGTFESGGQFGFQMQSATATVSGFPFRWRIQEGTIRTDETRVSIRPGAIIDFPEKESATLQAGLELRNLRAGVFTLFGNLDLDASWTDKDGKPVIDAKARTRSLFINDYELEAGRILAHYENGVIRFLPPPSPPTLISGAVHIQDRPQLLFDHFVVTGKEGQKLDLSGQAGPRLWDFVMTGQRMDLGVLSELAGFAVPVTGLADITARGTGDMRHPHLEGKARVRDGKIAILGFSEGDADFLWQDDRITFRRLRLSDKGRYTVLGSGVFPIRNRTTGATPLEKMNFSVRLENTNLGVLQSAFPEIRKARGSVEGLVQVQGTWDDPQMVGRIRIDDGDVTGAHYFRRLKDVQLVADLDGSALKIKELSMRSGNGTMVVTGETRLNGLDFGYYDLEAHIPSKEGIELQVPELAIPDSPLAKKFKFLTSTSRTIVKGSMHLQGPADSPTFRGELELSNGHFTFPPSSKKPAPVAWTQWVRRTFWDILLRFGEGLWYENELVQANMTGKIQIKGTGDQLNADGATVIPQGRISYLGLQFDIREANFDMKNNVPFIRAIADTKVEATDTIGSSPSSNPSQRYTIDDTITLNIDYGPLDQIKPRLTSAANPSLSQEKIFNRISRLETQNLSPEERTALYQSQVVGLIDNSFATPLAQNFLKRTGLVDRLRVQRVYDPSATPATDPANPEARKSSAGYDLLANTKYTAEKNLFNNLSVGYGMRFIPTISEETNTRTLDLVSDLQLSYQAFRNVYVRGSFDLPNANNPAFIPERKVTIEPRWRFGWWGNTNKEKLKKIPETPKP